VLRCRNIVAVIFYETGTLACSYNDTHVQQIAGSNRGYESFPLSEKGAFDQKLLVEFRNLPQNGVAT